MPAPRAGQSSCRRRRWKRTLSAGGRTSRAVQRVMSGSTFIPMAGSRGSGSSDGPGREAGVTWSVAAIDRMPTGQAAELLAECCGASRWVRAMVARRPFRRREILLSAADEVWRSLEPDDWKEAFAHHPRIGEKRSAVAQGKRERTWSRA